MNHKYSVKTIKKMRQLYKNGLGQRLVGRKLNIPWQSVWPYIKDISSNERRILPSRGITLPLPKSVLRLSKAKTRIISYLMADGYVSEIMKRNQRKNKFLTIRYSYKGNSMAFYNTDHKVIERFLKDWKSVYGTKLKYNQKRAEIKIFRKAVFNDLLKFGHFDSYRWRVPKQIVNGGASLKKEWIKAFCDSEASVDKKHRRIVIYSANKNGLLEIKKLLKDLSVDSYLNGPYAGAFRLKIAGSENLKRFYKSCNFYHSKKRKRMAEMMNALN